MLISLELKSQVVTNDLMRSSLLIGESYSDIRLNKCMVMAGLRIQLNMLHQK